MRRALYLPLILLLAACGSAPGAPAPVRLALGVDACEYCHMSIDRPEMAAQWVGEDGRARKFDEPGCLVAWLQRNPEARGTAFVADAAGEGWVPADSAHFVHGGTRTSMGFDLLAFRSAGAAADRAAATGGSIRDWVTLRREGVKDAHAH